MINDKKELKRLGKYQLKGLLGFLIVLILPLFIFISIGTFYDCQGQEAKVKLKPLIYQIQGYKERTGSYPKSLDSILKKDIFTRLGLYKYKLNVYEVTDSSFKVGWDNSEKRIYYDSHKNLWIDNMTPKF
jgi:hypothetical protein